MAARKTPITLEPAGNRPGAGPRNASGRGLAGPVIVCAILAGGLLLRVGIIPLARP